MALLASTAFALTTVAQQLTSLAGRAGVEEAGTHLSPYLVGAGTLLALLALLFAVIAIGGGREHS